MWKILSACFLTPKNIMTDTLSKVDVSRPGEPGVYVRLSVYYSWINDILSGDVEHIGEPLQVNAINFIRRQKVYFNIKCFNSLTVVVVFVP